MNSSTAGVKRCLEHIVSVLKQILYVSVGVIATIYIYHSRLWIFYTYFVLGKQRETKAI